MEIFIYINSSDNSFIISKTTLVKYFIILNTLLFIFYSFFIKRFYYEFLNNVSLILQTHKTLLIYKEFVK